MIFWAMLGWLIMGALGLALGWFLVITIWRLAMAAIEGFCTLIATLLYVTWIPLYCAGVMLQYVWWKSRRWMHRARSRTTPIREI